MKNFLSSDFLLQTDTAKQLYDDYASGMPIIDYHCHLSPKDIAENRKFKNITEAWLEGDHYKWRAMRTNGVDEQYCTGNADPKDKFQKWAETVPYTLRNPLYHWTHLELRRYFNIDELLDGKSAPKIYDKANEMLSTMGVQSLLKLMKVEVVATTDDPIDTLEYHAAWQQGNHEMIMVPAFRADKVLFTNDIEIWNKYMDKLSEASSIDISTYDQLLEALNKRHDYFSKFGCKLSDNGLNYIYTDDFNYESVAKTFKVLRNGKNVNSEAEDQFRSAVLYELAKMNHAKGWVQQYHLGALRNNSQRMYNQLGPDTGFDSIGDINQANNMSKFFDRLDATNQLTKTIIYNLNPADNEVFATMAGNFNDGSTPGKMQFGSGWWFNDQKDGMQRQMNALSNMGLISRFVGMLTDSRSFLSFPRHEYFRRILCNLFGEDIENGELPHDVPWIGKLVQDICYYNARNYFQFHEQSNKESK